MFRGACTPSIYDNMKTAVDAIFIGRDRHYNRRFLQMCGQYLVEPEACTSGWEKGQIENQVGLGASSSSRLGCVGGERLAGWPTNTSPTPKRRTGIPSRAIARSGVFEEERGSCSPYAGRFDGFHCVPTSVSKTCTVRFDNNRYSVLSSAVGRPVENHAYADRMVLVVGEQARLFGRR